MFDKLRNFNTANKASLVLFLLFNVMLFAGLTRVEPHPIDALIWASVVVVLFFSGCVYRVVGKHKKPYYISPWLRKITIEEWLLIEKVGNWSIVLAAYIGLALLIALL